MKNERLQSKGIVHDDQAVALTEFCIVMPVVLFLFLAVLQFFQVVRAAQMVNYASYIAARSYAVLHSEDQAKTAAVMAMAPVSNNIGIQSLGGLGGGMSGISSLFSSLASVTPGGARYGNGLISAYLSLSFGNFSVATNAISGSSLTQVSVTINYPQFINIPGFGGLWRMFSGNDNFFASQNAALAYAKYLAQDLSWSKGLASADVLAGLALAQGSINVPGQCTTGYEAWGDPTAYKNALDNNNNYNTAYTGWWPGTSGSWQPRVAAQP
jgi:hypothetical protein